jgi:MerR family transcriptional regulator, light-induced transcriptional regulator
MSEMHYAIKTVAKITGLSPHVIRVWEKRYSAVTPKRTATNRRVYTDADVQRLGLLREATASGHSIGQIATLPDARLATISAELSGTSRQAVRQGGESEENLVERSLEAIYQLDSQHFEALLTKGLVALGQHGLLELLICPLVKRIGDLWREGSLKAMHEHFASAVIRNFLARNSQSYSAGAEMPTIVVATPAGQLHELGALMVARAASDMGWRVIYVGTSLPAAEIASAAMQNRARAVALSIVYPEDDSALPGELENLRSYLPKETKIVTGGRAAEAYREVLIRIGAVMTSDLRGFYGLLDSLRILPPV